MHYRKDLPSAVHAITVRFRQTTIGSGFAAAQILVNSRRVLPPGAAGVTLCILPRMAAYLIVDLTITDPAAWEN